MKVNITQKCIFIGCDTIPVIRSKSLLLLIFNYHYLHHYEVLIILGDFNESEHYPKMHSFLSQQGCKNIIKNKTCFKSMEESCINLILTSRTNLHQVFQLGMSDYHLMIYAMLKSTCPKLEPTVLRKRQYKHFSKESCFFL